MAHRTSKTASFHRILNDLLRFNEEQLHMVIEIAKKVRSSKRTLRKIAAEADQFVSEMQDRNMRQPQIEHQAVEDQSQ